MIANACDPMLANCDAIASTSTNVLMWVFIVVVSLVFIGCIAGAYRLTQRLQGLSHGVPMFPDRKANNRQWYWERNAPPFTYNDLVRLHLNEAQARLVYGNRAVDWYITWACAQHPQGQVWAFPPTDESDV